MNEWSLQDVDRKLQSTQITFFVITSNLFVVQFKQSIFHLVFQKNNLSLMEKKNVPLTWLELNCACGESSLYFDGVSVSTHS